MHHSHPRHLSTPPVTGIYPIGLLSCLQTQPLVPESPNPFPPLSHAAARRKKTAGALLRAILRRPTLVVLQHLNSLIHLLIQGLW